MNITKKIVASLLGLSLLVFPGVTTGTTVEELQAQIADLLAQINVLQAQLAGLTGTPTGVVSCTFTKNLAPGSTGTDVQCLQRYLNSAGHQVAATGVGSPGNETQYFGPLTQAAVKAWQDANGVVYGAYGGYFGPISQAKYNSLLAAAPTVPTTPTTPTTPVSDITTPGAEGSFTVKYAATPITGEDVYDSATGVGIAGFEVKATGSDVRVERIDVNFTSRPWLNVAKIHVLDGSTVVRTQNVTSADTLEVTVGSSYTVRITGVNVVVPKDTTKTLNLQIDPLLLAGETTTTVTYRVLANGVRGIDGASLQLNEPSSALADRTFVVKASDKAELELSEHPDNKTTASNIVVSTSVTTTDVPLLAMNVKSKTNASIIRTISVTAANSASSTDFTYKLYDGSTLLKSASESNGVATFDDLSISIAKDATKALHVKADIAKQSAVTGTASGTLTVNLASTTASGIQAEDATTFTSIDITGSAVATGNFVMFDKAPILALVSASASAPKQPSGGLTGSNTSESDIAIKINITAQGGDIYVASNTSSGVLASTSPEGASTTFVGGATNTTFTTNATETTTLKNWLITNGTTKWFEVVGTMKLEGVATDSAIYVKAFLNQIVWGITDAAADRTTQDWGLENYKTNEVLLSAPN